MNWKSKNIEDEIPYTSSHQNIPTSVNDEEHFNISSPPNDRLEWILYTVALRRNWLQNGDILKP